MPTVGETWYTTNAKWRTLSRNDWGYAFADDVLIRYVDVTDARLCESVLDYIATIATFAGSTVVTDGKAIGASELWVTHFVRYETITLPRGELGFRIQHALRPQATSTGDGAYIVENNCTFKVSWTFYWRVPSIIQPVTAGTSGITYAIQGVSRDRETGDYSYVIEKREQLTTHIAEHRVSETDFETVYEQQFLGVRESSSGSGVYNKDNTGAVISALWDVHDVATVGTRYTQNITKNANCTADVTQRKTVAKVNVVARQVLDHDQFRTVTATQTNNQATADVDDVAPADGKVTRKEASHNGDGTSNNILTEEQEHQVDESVKREVETAAETVTEVENSGQSAAYPMPATPTEGTLVEVVNTKTKGGWFIQRIITRIAQLWESRFVRVSKDLYEVQTETHDDGVATIDLPEDPPDPSLGVWYERFRIKRPDRKYDVREVKHEEKALTAGVSRTKTLFEDVSETDEIVDEQPPAPDNAGSGISYGIAYRKTPGGLFRAQGKTTQEIKAEKAITSWIKTPFETRSVEVTRNNNIALAEPPTVGNFRRNTKTNGGWQDTENDVRTPVANVTEASSKTIQGLETRSQVDKRNEPTAPTLPIAQTPGTVEEVLYRLNDLNVYDVKRVTETGEKFVYTFTVKDERGDIYVTRYYNHTAAEELALLSALDGARSNTATPGQINKFRLFDGVIVSRPASGAGGGSNTFAWSQTGKTQIEKRIVDVDGVRKVQTWTYTYNMKKDWGISGGSTDYSGALMPGSFFHDLGNDWYFYKKVTNINVTEADFAPGTI